MKLRTPTLLALTGIIALTGCATRQIDPQESGSVPVAGTSWMRFCDGPNAVIWVPGRTGKADELEAYVYDHHECAETFYAENPQQAPTPPPADDDGINEDE